MLSTYFALPVSCLAVAFTFLGAVDAHAGHDRTLYRAADDYRDAVVDFERHANHLDDHIDRYTLRLIDRLEDTTGDLRNATRHRDAFQRILYEFNEVQSLHPRVEQAVFGTGCPIIAAKLTPCWSQVQAAFSGLQYQIASLQSTYYGAGYQSGRPGYPSCGINRGSTALPLPNAQPIVPALPPTSFQAPSRLPVQPFPGSATRMSPGSAMLRTLLMHAFR